MSEDLKEGRGVIDVLEPWVLVNGVAKVRPRCPGGVGPAGLSSRDCIFCCVLDSQELGLEAQCAGGVANFQGSCEGAKVLIFCNNSASER